MEGRSLSLRDLHRLVESELGKGVRGSSYGAVRSLVVGDVEQPRPDVVRALAKVLGVRSEYLLELEGPRTAVEAVPHDAAPLSRTGESEWTLRLKRLTRLIRSMDGVGLPFGRDHLVHEMRPVLDAAVIMLLDSGDRPFDDFSEEEVRDALSAIAWLWVLPLEVLGTRDQVQSDLRRWRAYWSAVGQAWNLALPDRGGGSPEKTMRHIENIQTAFALTEGLQSNEQGVKRAPGRDAGWITSDAEES